MRGRDCNFNGATPETEEISVRDVTTSQDQDGPELSVADDQLLRDLTAQARAGVLKLTGERGLPGKLTKMVVEGALEDVHPRRECLRLNVRCRGNVMSRWAHGPSGLGVPCTTKQAAERPSRLRYRPRQYKPGSKGSRISNTT